MIYNSNDTSDLNSSNIHCHLKWKNLPDLGKDGIVITIIIHALCDLSYSLYTYMKALPLYSTKKVASNACPIILVCHCSGVYII